MKKALAAMMLLALAPVAEARPRLAGRIGSLPRAARANGTTAAGRPGLVSHRTLRGGGAPLRLDRTAGAETWRTLIL